MPVFLETVWIMVSFPELKTTGGEAHRRGGQEELVFFHVLL